MNDMITERYPTATLSKIEYDFLFFIPFPNKHNYTSKKLENNTEI